MGGIVERKPGEPYVETAVRTILFTDMQGSTRMTQQLGDAGAMTVLRRHDEMRSRLRRTRHGGLRSSTPGMD